MADKKILDNFISIMREKGLNVTLQRIAVLEEIVKYDGHCSSEDIYMAVKISKSYVSRATVYRTLEILVKNNFIRKLNLGDGRSRYEIKINSQHHDHLICNECGKIFEFVDLEIEKLQIEVAKSYGFALKRHIHQLFGICSKCQ